MSYPGLIAETVTFAGHNGDKGEAYACRQLVALGAPARRAHEDGAAYARRVLPSFRAVRHPGNHVYTWRFDRRDVASLPYPKSE